MKICGANKVFAVLANQLIGKPANCLLLNKKSTIWPLKFAIITLHLRSQLIKRVL